MENKWLKRFPKKKEWVVLLLIGVLLMVIAIPTKQQETTGTSMEQKLEDTLEKIEGVGPVHVMLTYREGEQLEGIVVLCERANQPIIVRNITEVIQALFEVDAHKIKVIESTQTK